MRITVKLAITNVFFGWPIIKQGTRGSFHQVEGQGVYYTYMYIL